MWWRFEIIAILCFGTLVFSQRFENSDVSANTNNRDVGGLIKGIGSGSLGNIPESLSGTEGEKSSSGRSSFNNEKTSFADRESFSSRPGQSSSSLQGGNQQGSFSRPSTDRETFSNRPGQSSSSLLGGNQQESFSNRPGQSSSSLLGGNQQGSFGNTPNEGHSNVISKPTDANYSNVTIEEPIDEEEEKEICFQVLGCFPMVKPWRSVLRPIGKPFGPEKINTNLRFFSRGNPTNSRNIILYPQINMGTAQFDPKKITVIIVHGFSQSGNAVWMKDMANAYLKQVDANVFIVDWGGGAQHLNYLEVCSNTRVVGKQLALFVEYLKKNYGADTKKFHLIGHSLGAQICSYLAKEVPGIARLTALDPAQPGFEGFDPQIRLDKSDADFVDVVHTDAKPFLPTLGFGMIAPHGHVDFYVNGGFDQPGCSPLLDQERPQIKSILDLGKYSVETIIKTVACPHSRAYEILTESFNDINNCIFWGHKADIRNVFKSVTNTLSQGLLKKLVALSPTCSTEDCIPLGLATRKSLLRGSFVITTNAKEPFCISEPGIPAEVAGSGKNL